MKGVTKICNVFFNRTDKNLAKKNTFDTARYPISGSIRSSS